jgi:recombination protein RecT
MTQMVKSQDKVANVRTMLERLKPQMAMALPRHMTPDRLARVAMTCVLQTPKLLECDQTSLAGAIITCAQLGLEPDPTLAHVHLVPFRNRRRGTYEVVVIPGYRGLMKLARNSGDIATIDAHVVHQKDTFRYAYGLKPQLHHVPYQGADDPGPATHYYAVATWKTGSGQFVVMTRAQVEAHRDRFAKNVDEESPWRTDFDAMASKTCIRQLAKFLPASVELQRAAALDEQAEAGIPQDLGGLIDVSGVTSGAEGEVITRPAASKLDALADELEDKRPGGASGEAEQLGITA